MTLRLAEEVEGLIFLFERGFGCLLDPCGTQDGFIEGVKCLV